MGHFSLGWGKQYPGYLDTDYSSNKQPLPGFEYKTLKEILKDCHFECEVMGDVVYYWDPKSPGEKMAIKSYNCRTPDGSYKQLYFPTEMNWEKV